MTSEREDEERVKLQNRCVSHFRTSSHTKEYWLFTARALEAALASLGSSKLALPGWSCCRRMASSSWSSAGDGPSSSWVTGGSGGGLLPLLLLLLARGSSGGEVLSGYQGCWMVPSVLW